MPIEIISTIIPKNGQPFPSHESEFGKGGWHSVHTVEERDAIPTERREEGMAVRVGEENTTYFLLADLVTWRLDNSSGVPDAPIDGVAYVRKDAAWEPINDSLDEGTYA